MSFNISIMSSLPTIVFIPETGFTSAGFQEVINILSRHGHEIVCLCLPFVGENPIAEDTDPGKTKIRSAVTKLVEDCTDVAVVSHL